MSLLEVAGLTAGYGSLRIVFDAALEVAEGEFVGVVGPNGAGKTTLLGAVVGAVRSTADRISFDGRDIRGCKPEDAARGGLGLVPEGRHIFSELTVDENLRLGLTARRDRSGAAAALDRVRDLFPVLTTHTRARAGMLSGGQQQQLAIARALVAEPRMLMLDEPSLGLSPTVVTDVFSALHDIQENGTAILIVEQRAHLVISRAARTHIMREGRIQDTLVPADASDSARLAQAYFGEVAST